MATFPTIRRHIIAEFVNNGQGNVRLLFTTEQDGSRYADSTLYVDEVRYPGTLSWVAVRVMVAVDGGVSYELRHSAFKTLVPIVHTFRGKSYTSSKCRAVWPVFGTMDELIQAIKEDWVKREAVSA